MKIAFVMGYPFVGAAWTRIGYFASYFSKRVHQTVILSSITPTSLRRKRIKVDGTTVFNRLPAILLSHPLITWFNATLSFMFSLPFILALNPDVMVLSVPPGETAFGVFLSCKLLRKKVVFDYRDEWEDFAIGKTGSKMSKIAYRFLKKLMTLLYVKSRFVVTETPAHARALRERGIQKTYLVPNGADLTVFHPADKPNLRARLGFQEDDFIILYSGRVEGYYRLDVVVNALSIFKRGNNARNVKLAIVGEGAVLSDLLNLAERLGEAESVVYLGLKNQRRELVELTACADVGVVPYDDNPLWKNTCPAKFFEYCACGVPVVATTFKDSVLAKLINNHNVGLVADPLNAKDLANAVEKLYYMMKFRQMAGQRARKLVETHFDRARSADRLLKLIFHSEYS